MGRRHRRKDGEAKPLSAGFSSRSLEGDWLVQSVPGAAADKTYRCPGCEQEIASGMAHVVAWSQVHGPEQRRHWHTACWRARPRRH